MDHREQLRIREDERDRKQKEWQEQQEQKERERATESKNSDRRWQVKLALFSTFLAILTGIISGVAVSKFKDAFTTAPTPPTIAAPQTPPK
ncbi:hypothetical protein [Limnoglobus roseus]|nr:hypothetical protein [Limnoglobus roseus]